MVSRLGYGAEYRTWVRAKVNFLLFFTTLEQFRQIIRNKISAVFSLCNFIPSTLRSIVRNSAYLGPYTQTDGTRRWNQRRRQQKKRRPLPCMLTCMEYDSWQAWPGLRTRMSPGWLQLPSRPANRPSPANQIQQVTCTEYQKARALAAVFGTAPNVASHNVYVT